MQKWEDEDEVQIDEETPESGDSDGDQEVPMDGDDEDGL